MCLVEVLEQLIDALHEKLHVRVGGDDCRGTYECGSWAATLFFAVYLVGPDYIGKLLTPGAGYLVWGRLTLYFGSVLA